MHRPLVFIRNIRSYDLLIGQMSPSVDGSYYPMTMDNIPGMRNQYISTYNTDLETSWYASVRSKQTKRKLSHDTGARKVLCRRSKRGTVLAGRRDRGT